MAYCCCRRVRRCRRAKPATSSCRLTASALALALQAQCIHYACFLQGVELFDNLCFAVSLAEASVIDPQQRLLLERGYETLRSGGLTRGEMQANDAGVFLGITNADDLAWMLVRRYYYIFKSCSR